MEVFLETERIALRRFTEGDVDNLFALDGDPEVMRYLTRGPGTPREEIEHDILPHFLAYYARDDRFGFWAAVEKATGDFLGWFHFRAPRVEHPAPGEIELGYRLRRQAWGKGYATEVSRALIDKGFGELGVQKVVASAALANVGSWRVMEKVGMRRVRVYRISFPDLFNGEEQEDVEYALTREEWERRGNGAR